MRNQLLFLMYFLATTEGFAGGSGVGGSGPPMRSIGALENGTSMIGPPGHSVNCSLNEAQLVIVARGTNEILSLNPLVIARTSGGSGSGPPGKFAEAFEGSSGSGPLGKKTEVVAAIDLNSLSKLKFFVENNEDLIVKNEHSWLEVQSVNYFADPDQVEIVLESASIKLTAFEGGITGIGPPAKRISAKKLIELDLENATVKLGGGGSGGTIPSSAKGGSTAGGGTFGNGGGGTIGDASSGTLAECGISGEIGGSGVGGDGWKKDGGSMGGSTEDADGIAVGGGTPYN